ncbi:MAG: 23S rRNA (adenine(1618)-N(6))-methyltransferase [Bacteroidetes bacterium GWF2_41_61]|nr:MAG: 23S rRNA (adenine(1618)-N(6))-methyltransferase [Bacteroidetes bacterium GWF2_41_61]
MTVQKRDNYNFEELIASFPELSRYVITNEYSNRTIDFFDPIAVRTLNKALLKHHYGIDYWEIPSNYLCPPIPSRADYIATVADLLSQENNGSVPAGPGVKILDIGVGANCIYPIIGCVNWGWSFVGTDIDPVAVVSAKEIVKNNAVLAGKIDIRLQIDSESYFNGILKRGEKIEATICNPPFHSSAEQAAQMAQKKLRNLNKPAAKPAVLNFGGSSNELWCPGGEEHFVKGMVAQSADFAGQCHWFTSLISKKESLAGIYSSLKRVEAKDVRTIPIARGNKISRVVAWRF